MGECELEPLAAALRDGDACDTVIVCVGVVRALELGVGVGVELGCAGLAVSVRVGVCTAAAVADLEAAADPLAVWLFAVVSVE